MRKQVKHQMSCIPILFIHVMLLSNILYSLLRRCHQFWSLMLATPMPTILGNTLTYQDKYTIGNKRNARISTTPIPKIRDNTKCHYCHTNADKIWQWTKNCFSNVCGLNADCCGNNHRAIYVCRTGFFGDPYTICEEHKLTEHKLG